MANGRILISKQSGGVTTVTSVDGAGNTNLVLPESGIVATEAYADTKQAKGELAYNVDTSSYIPNTLASGAIIEKGSNANGGYIKFADGTLICTKTESIVANVSTASGALFISSTITARTFPFAFISVPEYVNITADGGNPGSWVAEDSISSISTAWKAFRIADTASSSGATYIVKFYAIGRWK